MFGVLVVLVGFTLVGWTLFGWVDVGSDGWRKVELELSGFDVALNVGEVDERFLDIATEGRVCTFS